MKHYIQHELKHHAAAYTVLLGFLAGSGALYLLVWPDRPYQRLIALTIATGYFLWGVITHVKNDHLTMHIVLEYLAIAALAAVLLISITL